MQRTITLADGTTLKAVKENINTAETKVEEIVEKTVVKDKE